MQKSDTFCIHPFTRLVTREDGAIKPCCRSQPIGWIQNETLEDAWNNTAIKEMREKLLNNSKPLECYSCFQLEDQGVESLRLRHLNKTLPSSVYPLYKDNINDLNDDYSMPYTFPVLEIKLNNLCNLKCRMCSPLDSTSWNDWNQVKEYYVKEGNHLPSTIDDLGLTQAKYVNFFNDNWWDSFYKILPHLSIIEFGGGEPLIDPQHYEILDILIPYAHNIELRYATNGTSIGISNNRTIDNYWPKFKNVVVNVSIDGIHEVYNYIRTNSNFETVKKNIIHMRSISSVSRVVGKFTAQGLNILQMAECIEYFIEELRIPFFSHRVSYPNILSAQVLPKELKQLAIFRLESVLNKIPLFKNKTLFNINIEQITCDNIRDTIQYLNGIDQSARFNEFIKFNQALDITRKSRLEQVIPEFLTYV